MTDNLLTHPTFTQASDITAICSPLQRLNITYFAHVNIDQEGNFAAIGNNPAFGEIYLKNKYYDADIHMANSDKFKNYVLWDAIQLKNKSNKMHEDASYFGVKHTFTIIERNASGNHFYHFATNSESKSINQVYLSNLDLLKYFILYFNENIQQSKELLNAYDLKFSIDKTAEGYTVHDDSIHPTYTKSEFLEALSLWKNSSNGITLIHKDTNKLLTLAPQQSSCLTLFINGYSAKTIAKKLGLATRTVEHYLAHIRKKLGCKNGKEILLRYQAQVNDLIVT